MDRGRPPSNKRDMVEVTVRQAWKERGVSDTLNKASMYWKELELELVLFR